MSKDGRSRGMRIVRAIGLLLSAIAVAYIVVAFTRSHALEVLRHVPLSSPVLAGLVVACAIGYALAMLLPGLGWWQLTSALATSAPPISPILASYAVTQYGKYLPGNVAHYALRHAWSRRFGLSHAALALASMLEALLLLIAAVSLVLFADTHGLPFLSFIPPHVALALIAAMILMLGLGLRIAQRRELLRKFSMPALPRLGVQLRCIALYLVFFIACAGVMSVLAHAFAIDIPSFSMLLGAAAASWLAGFVVIGAPGGLGVREAAFVALVGAALGEDHALVLIASFRVVTFLGDTLFFLAGTLAMRGSARAADAR